MSAKKPTRPSSHRVRCVDCFYSEEMDHGDMECRLNAPVHTEDAKPWPVVRPDDWCGHGAMETFKRGDRP